MQTLDEADQIPDGKALDEATQTVGEASQIADREDFIDAVCERMKEYVHTGKHMLDAQMVCV